MLLWEWAATKMCEGKDKLGECVQVCVCMRACMQGVHMLVNVNSMFVGRCLSMCTVYVCELVYMPECAVYIQ